MIMWVMSDRAIPRSYRTMQGFGVNTCELHVTQIEFASLIFRSSHLSECSGRTFLREVSLDP